MQLDFNQPERFGLGYTAPDGGRHRPVMIHRGVLSARWNGWSRGLIERTTGRSRPGSPRCRWPCCRSAEPHAGPARSVADRLLAAGLRAECDPAGATLGARIRQARDRKIPYMAVIGDREAAGGLVALRLRDGRRLDGDQRGPAGRARCPARSPAGHADLGFR